MIRMLFRIVVATVAVAMLAVPAAGANRVIEPSGSPVTITYNAQGVPQQFTIKVSGFQPGDLVAVEQCDGTPVSDPNWLITRNCDTATVPAQANADAKGVVTFPANDINFGFQPIVGTSPQKFFNCLGPGQPDPKNGLHSFSTCQVRVATSYLKRTTDEVFFPIDFGGTAPAGSTGASGSNSTSVGVIVAIVAVALAVVGAIVFAMRRRPARARSTR